MNRGYRVKGFILAIALATAASGARAGESPIAFILGQARQEPTAAPTGPPTTPMSSRLVDEAAQRYGVPATIARAVLWIESGGRCGARSRAGAIGAMQVLPATARAMGVYGPLTVCANSIEAGTRYLARIIAAHGQGCAALSLYNRGEAARPICTKYGRTVLAYAGKVDARKAAWLSMRGVGQ
jgi:soluble lytic murein transglycosylase-like protein